MIDFNKILKTIEQIEKEIKGLSFEQAAKSLAGYNYDGQLFDYDYPIDDTYFLVGTIVNDHDKPVMYKNSFYEIWTEETGNNRFASQILAMTEEEIRQQVKRLH